MLPTYVGLVPLETPTTISPDRLGNVAAALQAQVVSDFGPVWGIAAVVSAFATLEDLPPGYLPLVVTTNDLPRHRRGFHLMMGGLPFGIVRYDDKDGGWTVAASHELLEMLCDPFAQRTALGPSLSDNKNDQLTAAGKGGDRVIEGDTNPYVPQGFVNYLVEVCDPCEESTYEINGVTVSDFVTPSYYDTRGSSSGPYSFRGGIKSQLGVLEGGSISWRPLLPQALVYQAEAEHIKREGAAAGPRGELEEVSPAELKIRKVVDGSSGLAVASQKSAQRAATLARGRKYHTTYTAWSTAGSAVRADLHELLAYLKLSATHRPPSIDEIIAFLEKITKDYVNFKRDPTKELAALGLKVDGETKVPTLKRYKEILSYLKQQKKAAAIFGPDLSGQDTALWLCMQIG